MAKGPRANAKTDAGTKASLDGFRNRRDGGTPDTRYLEVVEEMLRQRENNGRDRDESVGAVKEDH
jgi:hypothetical protein